MELKANSSIAFNLLEIAVFFTGQMEFGNDFNTSDDQLNYYSALFSKELRSVKNKAAYKVRMEEEADDCVLQIQSWRKLAGV